jgi:hypothetical protein
MGMQAPQSFGLPPWLAAYGACARMTAADRLLELQSALLPPVTFLAAFKVIGSRAA